MHDATNDDEPLELCDEHGNPAGIAPRGRVHRDGLLHRAVHVLLFRSDGRLIVQRRAAAKDIYPGAWDLSVAEHLRPGESFEQGAERGLREELGVDGVRLEPLGEAARARLTLPERAFDDHELQQTFRGVFDGELRPSPEEVGDVDVIAVQELALALERRPDDFTPWFRATAARLGLAVGVTP